MEEQDFTNPSDMAATMAQSDPYGSEIDVIIDKAHLKKILYLCIKRIFDVSVAFTGLIVLTIPFIVISICIKLDSSGPVFIKQKRMGKHGGVFYIYKFRTMYRYVPDNVATSLLSNPHTFVTHFGRLLRKTSIDELPQLINVLRGDMSLVGFRPVCLSEIKLNALREEYGVFACKPGITGLAQVRGRDDLPYKEKAKIDRIYTKNRSLGLDLYILLKTIPVTLSQHGVKW